MRAAGGALCGRHGGPAASTVRYYRNKLAMFLPVEGVGRKRLYPKAAKEIIAQAARMIREQGYSIEQVQRAFEKKIPITIDATPKRQTKGAEAKGAAELRAIKAEITHLRAEHQAIADAQKATLAAVRQLTEQVQLLTAEVRRRK